MKQITVLLMDIAMPRLNGLEATRQVLKAVPATKVLILSIHDTAGLTRYAISAGIIENSVRSIIV